MFEFRPTEDMSELQIGARKQSKVIDDSDPADDIQGGSRRRQQHEGGMFGDADAGAEDAEDRGEAVEFGDEEEDEVQNVGVGLGLEGHAL
jgi:hypothetical protein